MTIAVAHDGHHAGVTVAEVNLKFIWDLINAMQVGHYGYAYVVDQPRPADRRSRSQPCAARYRLVA